MAPLSSPSPPTALRLVWDRTFWGKNPQHCDKEDSETWTLFRPVAERRLFSGIHADVTVYAATYCSGVCNVNVTVWPVWTVLFCKFRLFLAWTKTSPPAAPAAPPGSIPSPAPPPGCSSALSSDLQTSFPRGLWWWELWSVCRSQLSSDDFPPDWCLMDQGWVRPWAWAWTAASL